MWPLCNLDFRKSLFPLPIWFNKQSIINKRKLIYVLAFAICFRFYFYSIRNALLEMKNFVK